MTTSVPDVSVVVIGYNDAGRIGRAIASVQRQTLRNLEIIVVDDASTDSTAEVVRRIADDDPRVSYLCLSRNSGGCSAPRNTGVDAARAPWVMFCDSDDEYERHACKNLLQAAERLDVDLVCGTAERVDIATGKSRRWRPELHDVEVAADGLAAFPELLADTISVNKIYRRSLLVDNGIRFPEGLLFEDQLFTLQAMASARGMAAIPQTVYRWYVDELSDEPSITQRRHEAENVESRIEINRRIDAYLAEPGREDIRVAKDHKFLRHDLYLYLASMLEVDDETATVLMDRLRPYVSTVNLEPAWRIRPALRVAIFHLLVGDLEGIRSAMRYVKWASVVDASIVERAGREFWASQHLDGDVRVADRPVSAWLDVTDMHLRRVPFTQKRFLHRISEFRVEGGRVLASGSSVDYDGSLRLADGVELRFVVGSAQSIGTVPARWTGSSGHERRWTAEGPIEPVWDRLLTDKDRGTVAVTVTRGEHENTTSARAGLAQALSATIDYPGDVTTTGPDVLVLDHGRNGAVGWRARRSPRHARAAGRLAAWNRVPGVRLANRLWQAWRREVAHPVVSVVGTVLPARNLVLFDSSATRPWNDNVRALSAELRRQQPEVAQSWVHARRPDRVPDGTTGVVRGTLAHRWQASRARWLVDDGTASLGVRSRSGAVMFVGDGIPVHRVGLDDPSNLTDEATQTEIRTRSRRWDTALVPSDFADRVLAEAFDFAGPTALTGLVRADTAVVAHRQDPELRARVRERLDLALDRPVVLYVPTLRAPSREPVDPLIDVEEWSRAIGDQVYLVVRGHPLQPLEVSTRWRFAVRDVTDAVGVGDYVAACDLLISDYSSVIADAALAGVPTLLFQPDYERYVNRAHGTYGDLGLFAPAASSTTELIGAVERWLADPEEWGRRHGPALEAFVADRCGPNDGRSAARAAAALLAWEPRGSGPGAERA